MAAISGEQLGRREEGTSAAREPWSPRRVARAAAVFNILSGVAAGFSVAALTKIFVRDDPSATAANVLRFESSLRGGMAAELFALAMFASAMVLVYGLFQPVGRRCARVFLALTLIGTTIQALDVLADFAAVSLLKGQAVVSALPAAEAQALAYVCLKMHSFAYTVALVFMGFGSLCLAFLVRRARFLPRFIGWIYPLDGLGLLTSTFATLLAPALAVQLRPLLPFGTAFIAEGALYFWLAIRGVDERRWYEQAE